MLPSKEILSLRKNYFLMVIPFALQLPIIRRCCNDRLNPPEIAFAVPMMLL